MKISAFAKKYDVNNDTIRYYMQLNLITPAKKGGHYNFDKNCEQQLEEILELKTMGFTLKEIKEIFNYKRIGKLTPYEKYDYFQKIYENKLSELNKEIAHLKSAKAEVIEKISEMKSSDQKTVVTQGLDLNLLSLFACPNCQQDLKLTAKNVQNSQIFDGKLMCDCGCEINIIDGILYYNIDPNVEKLENDFIKDYINDTDSDFIDKVYQSIEWLINQIDFQAWENKIILEPGSGSGIFLRQIFNQIPDNTTYICVDNQPAMNIYLKRMIEALDKKINIIFITSNVTELPLKQHSIDGIVDYSGTTGYSFDNEKFLPEVIDPLIKTNVFMYSTYIIYHKFGPNNIVDKAFRHNFIQQKIKSNLRTLGYTIHHENKSAIKNINHHIGKYEEFAQPGDQIYTYQVYAERWS